MTKAVILFLNLCFFFFYICYSFRIQIQNTKKPNKIFHKESLLLNDTDITSDGEEHIFSRNPKTDSIFSNDKTLHETFSIITKPKPITIPKSFSAIGVKTNSQNLNLLYIVVFNGLRVFAFPIKWQQKNEPTFSHRQEKTSLYFLSKIVCWSFQR